MSDQPRNRLAELRGDLKRHELAVELGVDPTTLWRWEAGRNAVPDEHKRALAARYGVTVEYLMGWSDDPVRPGEAVAS